MHRAKKSKQAEAHCSEWSEQPRTPGRDLCAIATIAITQNRQFTKWLCFHKNKREMDMQPQQTQSKHLKDTIGVVNHRQKKVTGL